MTSRDLIAAASALFSFTAIGGTAAFVFWLMGRVHRASRDAAAEHGVFESAEVRRDGLIWGALLVLVLLLPGSAGNSWLASVTARHRERIPTEQRAYWGLVLRQNIATAVGVTFIFGFALIAAILGFARDLLP